MISDNFFEKRIKPILLYVGTIGAVIMAIAYIITVFVLIIGFNAQKNLIQSITFAIVNAIIGLIIMQFLKIQGVSFAKNLPENKAILERFIKRDQKEKKSHSITFYWVTSVTKDVLIKALTIAGTTAGIIYIVIEGSNDWNLLALAIVNLLMFVCFGLLSLNSAYDFYNEQHIPFILDQLKEKTNDNS